MRCEFPTGKYRRKGIVGACRDECPRCTATDSAVMGQAADRDDTVLICIACGCEYYRLSRTPLRPYGVEAGDWEAML